MTLLFVLQLCDELVKNLNVVLRVSRGMRHTNIYSQSNKLEKLLQSVPEYCVFFSLKMSGCSELYQISKATNLPSSDLARRKNTDSTFV